MRSVLLVAQIAPPSELVAARRVAGFSKYLARLGHSVVVLTSRVSGEGEIEGAERVIRTNDLLLTRLNWRRRHFAALTGQAGDGYAPPSILERVVVPDLGAVTWLPFALPAALRLAREERFDCVLTTSPPQSAHVVGLALKRRGVCWIADFRDGWTFEPQQLPWLTPAQAWADRGLEGRVASRADAVTGVTAPIADDLRRRFGVEVSLLRNGFDPEEEGAQDGDRLLDPDRHSLVHTGRMAAALRSPKPLLDALRRLRGEAPEVAERLEVVFAGPLSEEERRMLGDGELAGLVRSLGSLERDRALRLQRQADSLLVLTEGTRRSVATGKLYEYLAAGRPILVLGEETDAARVVAEAGAGFAAPADDPVAIGAALRRLVESPPPPPHAEAVSRYGYPRLAEQLSGLIEAICRDR
jgi:glycosyltransferase involved in cell wall biosynthesis